MIITLRKGSLLWLILPLCAVCFLGWVNHRRIQRVTYVSALASHPPSLDKALAALRPDYTRGFHELIVPERNEESFAWIIQTEQMVAQRQARIRHVDYENAPFGHEVNAPSLFRWWLGFIAWLDHSLSHRPFGESVEHAALYANPLLHGLVLIGATLFIAWRFSFFAAALLALGLATLFPWATGFLPGVPDHLGLARAFAFGSVLLVFVGLRDAERPQRWFVLAGIVGGVGLWVDVRLQLPILAGLVLGALGAITLVKNESGDGRTSSTHTRALLWRTWAVSGAATVLVAYLLEYFPNHLGNWRLDLIHPLYGFAWLGAGEGLAQTIAWMNRKAHPLNLRNGLLILFVVIALAALPFAMSRSDDPGIFRRDGSTIRLTNEPGGVVSVSLKDWLSHDGMNTTVVCTLLPLLVIIPVGWQLLRRRGRSAFQAGLALAAGPVIVTLGFATQQISWWSFVDGTLLVLMVAGVTDPDKANGRSIRWRWSALAAALVVPSALHVWPGKPADAGTVLSPSEAQELVERHLAQWLAKRATNPGTVIYAPPHQTTTLSFYGGFRGVGTFAPENHAGFGAALTIAGANTIEEAQALIQTREVRYLIVPSWDPYFDEFARLYLDQRQVGRTSILVTRLRHLDLPLWLRPIPYLMPEIPGFERQTVFVFEVVDEQKPAVAASRLAEYLVETGKIQQAAVASKELQRFPGDVSALTARAQVCNAREDAAAFAKTVEELLSRISNNGDRFLPWDRRVSLAAVLAQADKIDLAREQVRRCVKEIDVEKVRALSPGALYQMLVLCQALKIEISDHALRDLALDLLPPDLRAQL